MTHLTIGDPAPWFIAPSNVNPTYHFDTVGGHRTVLSFFGSTQLPGMHQVIEGFCAAQPIFAKLTVPFFGVCIDAQDQDHISTPESTAFCKLIWDFERQVSRLYGIATPIDNGSYMRFSPITFVLNERMQIIHIIPITEPETHVAQVVEFVASLPPIPPSVVAQRQAPVLFIPHVLSQEMCRHLISQYKANGGEPSGFMRQVDGKTVAVMDDGFKRRRDFNIQDQGLLETLNSHMLRRVKPEIQKAYQYEITRFERHLVACYDASNQGFFNRHRDNTTKGTAHRRFAMTINLNTEEFEGGYLRFPEFGSQLYRPNTGEAVIFSCSLLHEATSVLQGTRYALLSFFYNDEAAVVRSQNRQYLVTEEPSSQAKQPVS
ncbi:2OG-Fe(II) oxygenase [Leptolyngbya sp. AN02str]|uniref:2OG-Fe(II) oxygenase n=1 Tax=Leptolyngbya sp. AN02str TaxID=3423363 RepID=UPI003D31F51E